MNYYNEHDPYAAQWLRNMMDADVIPRGHVDERSICDVTPTDLRGYVQCHFFAGIGGWSIALRVAGYADGERLWTGSCPCQSFSVAGQKKGQEDERHLWPEFFRLIRESRPNVVFGEQVPNAIGFGWLDGVSDDFESEGYAVGPFVFPSCSVGSPILRQRLFWVASTDSQQHAGSRSGEDQRHVEREIRSARHKRRPTKEPERVLPFCSVGSTDSTGSQGHGRLDQDDREPSRDITQSLAPASGVWSDYAIVHCRDNKSRRISPESGSFPLAYGVPKYLRSLLAELGGMGDGTDSIERVRRGVKSLLAKARRNRKGRLKGYGNAINPVATAVFLQMFQNVRANGEQG